MIKSTYALNDEIDGIEEAIDLMCRLHLTHRRQGRNLPYATHPFMVFEIVKSYTQELNIWKAAVLHDVLDKSENYSYQELVRDTNPIVARLVVELSEPKKYRGHQDSEFRRRTWRERKNQALRTFPTIHEGAQLIFAAEKVHNLRTLVKDYFQYGEEVWRKLNAGKDDMAWYYHALFVMFTSYFHHPIIGRYHQIYTEACSVLKWEK